MNRKKKTEYLQAGGVEQGTVFIQGETVKKVDHFKCLGVVVSADGSCEEEVIRRMQAGWQSWRRVSGVLRDRKLSARLKGKIYRCAERPAVLYGMETVAVTERMVKKMEAVLIVGSDLDCILSCLWFHIWMTFRFIQIEPSSPVRCRTHAFVIMN